MNQGIGSQFVGGMVTAMVGVIIVAAIYQLNKPNTPLVPSATGVANNTLGALFK